MVIYQFIKHPQFKFTKLSKATVHVVIIGELVNKAVEEVKI